MSDHTERVIVSWGSDHGGPLLCLFAGIHGNEPAGVLALERVFIKLQELDLQIRGRLIGLRGNLAGLRQAQRYVDVDLNRLWSSEELTRVHSTPRDQLKVEEKELLELLELIEAIRESEHSPQLFVDLHTTSAKGGAFSVVAHNASHRALAECLPVPMIFGLAPALAHTTNKFFEEHGMVGIAFESGQHDDPISIDRHEAAVWVLLEAAGCMAKEDIPEYDLHWQVLRDAGPAYRHLARALESGAPLREVSRADYLIEAAELARELGRPADAVRHYEAFLGMARSDRRGYFVQERLADARKEAGL